MGRPTRRLFSSLICFILTRFSFNLVVRTWQYVPVNEECFTVLRYEPFIVRALSSSSFVGYHFAVELTVDESIVKTAGEIFVAIHSNYEMLANISVTPKYVSRRRTLCPD